MEIRNLKFISGILVLIMLAFQSGSYADINDSIYPTIEVSEDITDMREFVQVKDVRLENEQESIYEIKFVSPELLERIITNADQEDEILKMGQGLTIGIITPKVLYLRGDIQSEDYLIKNRKISDMKEKITQHLIDIAFGRDNSNLILLKKDRKYLLWFDAEYTAKDIKNVLHFAQDFNNLSFTTQYEDETVMTGELKNNYQIVPYYYYNIKIVPKQYLENYKKDNYNSSKEEMLKDSHGEMIGFLSNDYVYLWNGLNESDRTYYLKKALLWSIGIHGESTTYPDSNFYTKVNTSTTLSDLDKEVIKMMYGGRLNEGMSVDEVRKALDISDTTRSTDE
jgi:hypothetical protein